MPRPSKEQVVLGLFFDYPTKHWHFSELEKESCIAASKLDKWLKRFIQDNLILRIKEKGRMPYYTANHENLEYRLRKRLFTLSMLYSSGLLSYLASLKAKNIIIFGSFTRSDWHKESDIDIFVYGDCKSLDIGRYESILHRNIEIFPAKDRKDLLRMGTGLLRNILSGMTITGSIPEEVLNACLQKPGRSS